MSFKALPVKTQQSKNRQGSQNVPPWGQNVCFVFKILFFDSCVIIGDWPILVFALKVEFIVF